jgi:hypothetical protein
MHHDCAQATCAAIRVKPHTRLDHLAPGVNIVRRVLQCLQGVLQASNWITCILLGAVDVDGHLSLCLEKRAKQPRSTTELFA